MSDLHFCPQCGTAVQGSALFCTSCGLALSTSKNDAPENMPVENNSPEIVTSVKNKPAESIIPKTVVPLFSRQVHMIIIIVIFAGIGVWIWSLERNKNSSDIEAVLTGKQNENFSPDNNSNPAVTIFANPIKAEDFAGVWRAYKSNDTIENNVRLGNPDDDLFIEVNNGNFNIYPRNEKDKEHSAEFSCSEVVGNTITCNGKSRADDSSFILKLEMNSSKNEITITIIPNEATEMMILQARRYNEPGN